MAALLALLPLPAVSLSCGRRRAVAHAAAAAATSFLASPTAPARAWCGERFPSWAYYVKWDETAVPFSWQGYEGELLVRVVGDKLRERSTGVPPVLLVGDPGVAYDYLENLEALTVSDRRVIEVTFAGTRGAAPPAARSVGACAAQLAAVCEHLSLQAVHLLAHGAAAPAALRLLQPAELATPLRSLTLVSPYGCLADLKAGSRPPADAKSLAALLRTTDPKAPGSCIADAIAATSAAPWLAMLSQEGAPSLRGEELLRLLQPAAAKKVATLVVWGGALCQ